ncbi:MAG: molybdopterin-dependent oxidoreductase, partial [Phycisphaeraceae bacterium]
FRSPTHKVQGTHEECDWNQAYKQVSEKLQQIVKDKGAPGSSSLAVMVSPMLPCEEAYLLGKLALAIDPQATLAVGPVPVKGEDKHFPGGYTVLAEKAPNARGVRRALGQLSDQVIEYDDLLKQLKDGQFAATLITGNYPSNWATPEFVEALTSGDRYNVLIDTLPSALDEKVDVMLPGATWAEKAGTFENHKHRLQSFKQAIPVIELAKNEGQIALDLLAAIGAAERQRYDVKELRREMGDAFVTDVHHPPIALKQLNDMQYVEL